MIPLFHLIVTLSLVSFSHKTHSAACKRTCGENLVSYPFGFSDRCTIKLNCSNAGNIKIGDFDVLNLSSDQIIVDLPAKCNRPSEELFQLFRPNFSPTRRNTLLFGNCISSNGSNVCVVPTGGCGYKLTCYSTASNDESEFQDKIGGKRNCPFLISSFVVDLNGSNTAGVDFQRVELGWWVDGNCNCVPNGNCTPVKGGAGYRCTCKEGYIGDGFTGGEGCWKESKHKSTRKKVETSLIIIGAVMLITVVTLAFILVRQGKKEKLISSTNGLVSIAPQRITYYEILQATKHFDESNLLGIGGCASVYRGVLRDRKEIAVKVFNLQSEDAFKSFDVECEVLRNIRHRNLTKVLTSCSNKDFKALVLEYMPNSNLEKWLYSHNYFLDLRQGLYIMIDVASALEYLHHGCSTPIIHCDLKPSNVLLDEEMIAHVSDFGIAKLLGGEESTKLTNTLATLGYIAPEYGLEGLVSKRCDVYSYGVMLMETFTRRKPSDDMFGQGLSLRSWVADLLPLSPNQVIDANLLVDHDDEIGGAVVLCVSSILVLALKCSTESPRERITIKEALAELQRIKHQFFQRRLRHR